MPELELTSNVPPPLSDTALERFVASPAPATVALMAVNEVIVVPPEDLYVPAPAPERVRTAPEADEASSVRLFVPVAEPLKVSAVEFELSVSKSVVTLPIALNVVND